MVLWIKALHIIAVISWMAGLLYLPRLFVYHADTLKGSPQSRPSRPWSIVFCVHHEPGDGGGVDHGALLAWMLHVYMDVWMILKFLLVCGLTAFHHAAVRWVKAFQEDRNTHPTRYFRIANEVPTLIMVAICRVRGGEAVLIPA